MSCKMFVLHFANKMSVLFLINHLMIRKINSMRIIAIPNHTVDSVRETMRYI